MVLAIFSLEGYTPFRIDEFIISAKKLLITFAEHFNNRGGHEYEQ